MSVIEHCRDGVGTVVLDRPAKRNALDGDTADAVAEAVRRFRREGASVAVLRATGPVFCAGNDLGDLGPGGAGRAPATRVVDTISGSGLLWVAVVEGPAIGAGVSLAAVCPVVLASTRARFELPETRMGLFPSVVYGQLARATGTRTAFTAALTGVPLDAREARDRGLVSEVVDPDGPGGVDGALDRWLTALPREPAFLAAAAASWNHQFTGPHERPGWAALESVLDTQFTGFASRRRPGEAAS